MRRLAYFTTRIVIWLIFPWFIKFRCLRSERSRAPGAWILASNHLSHFDPPVLTAVCQRKIDWMAMAELFENPWAARYFRWVDTIRTDRFKADRASVKEALNRLKRGHVVGIFPERGLRSGQESALEGAAFSEGAATLAQMAGVPIQPVVLIGSDKLYAPKTWKRFRATTLHVVFGDPIYADPALEKAAARADMHRRLAAAFLDLSAEAKTTFQLQPDDLPTTAQRRKGRE